MAILEPGLADGERSTKARPAMVTVDGVRMTAAEWHVRDSEDPRDAFDEGEVDDDS